MTTIWYENNWLVKKAALEAAREAAREEDRRLEQMREKQEAIDLSKRIYSRLLMDTARLIHGGNPPPGLLKVELVRPVCSGIHCEQLSPWNWSETLCRSCRNKKKHGVVLHKKYTHCRRCRLEMTGYRADQCHRCEIRREYVH